jgi:hypothetical protein
MNIRSNFGSMTMNFLHRNKHKRLVSSLIGNIRKGRLSNRMIKRIKGIPESFVRLLEPSGLDFLVQYVQNCNMDPEARASIISNLQKESRALESGLVDSLET